VIITFITKETEQLKTMAFSSSITTIPQTLTFTPSNKLSLSSSTTSFHLSFPSFQSNSFKTITTTSPLITRAQAPPSPVTTTAVSSFHGLCYVVGDNIDTDQIIPAEHLTLVPSNPDEYQKLGSFALIGLPDSYTVRFVESGETKTKYSIIIGGANFGCGSSREHAPVALGNWFYLILEIRYLESWIDSELNIKWFVFWYIVKVDWTIKLCVKINYRFKSYKF